MNVKCPVCDYDIPDNAKFCPGCSIPQTISGTSGPVPKKEVIDEIYIEKPIIFWPRGSTIVIALIIVFISICWLLLMVYGGEDYSLRPGERAFHGVDADAGDLVQITVRSKDNPISIYATSESNAKDPSLRYLKKFNLGPNERTTIEFNAIDSDTWGVVIVGSIFEGAEYKIQFLEPTVPGHIRYTWVPIIPIIFGGILLLGIDYGYYYLKKRKNIS